MMKSREQRMTTVTMACAIANLLLTIVKMAAGFFGRSAAMMADAIHSLSDVVADAVVLLMVRISAKGSDSRHNWGRGKYETIATLAISVLLIFIAIDMMKDGIVSIRDILTSGATEKPRMIALWAAVISIITQEVIFRWTVHVGKAVDSQTMIANAWHHRSDALASVASLLGIGGAIFIGGKWTLLDPLVGCLISIVILIIALRMFFPTLHELTEGSLPDETVSLVRDTIAQCDGICDIAALSTRRSGHCNVIDATLCVDSEMTVRGADILAESIRAAIREKLGDDTIISIQFKSAR